MLCIFCRYCFFFKQKTAYEMRISDWSSDVCSSDLENIGGCPRLSRSRYRPCTDFAAGGRGMMTSHHLHLVSDATGETNNSVARACLVQVGGIEPIEHFWSQVRTSGMMTKVPTGIEANPGTLTYTRSEERSDGQRCVRDL